MARLLYKQDTIARCKRMARRHARLCIRVKGAEVFAVTIQQALAGLIIAEKARITAEEQREDAYDDVMLCDSLLDNTIRTSFERIKQWERDNPGGLLETIFPNRTFSDIVNMPYSKEPQEVAKIIIRLQSLPDGHEIRQQIEPLSQRVAAINAAMEKHKQSITHLSTQRVAEELAANELKRVYEHNYLDARKKLGTHIAETIFPKVKTSHHTAPAAGEDDAAPEIGD